MTAPGARSPAGGSPPPELVARFKEALERLWPQGGKLGLAVSGGPDSLAMMLLAEAAIPGRFEVATVDHGLRPEAKDECAWVAEVCAARSIPCAILQVQIEPGNLQANARQARYLALGRWADERGLSSLATAHHIDDQAETLLMRLNRGSGLAGLAGIREQEWLASWVRVIRPLLSMTREELSAVVEASGLEPIKDPSNDDERFDRVRVRRFLSESDWLDPIALARSAQLLGDVSQDIQLVALDEWKNRVVEDEHGFRYSPRFGARSVEIEIVSKIIERMNGQASRSDVARLIDLLERDRGGNLAGVLASVERDVWVFRREPPRRTG